MDTCRVDCTYLGYFSQLTTGENIKVCVVAFTIGMINHQLARTSFVTSNCSDLPKAMWIPQPQNDSFSGNMMRDYEGLRPYIISHRPKFVVNCW